MPGSGPGGLWAAFFLPLFGPSFCLSSPVLGLPADRAVLGSDILRNIGEMTDYEARRYDPLTGTSVGAAPKATATEEPDEEDPFACFICRQVFVSPVKTPCGHIFCERCALRRFRGGDNTCAICQAPTRGAFTAARNLQSRGRLAVANVAAPVASAAGPPAPAPAPGRGSVSTPMSVYTSPGEGTTRQAVPRRGGHWAPLPGAK